MPNAALFLEKLRRFRRPRSQNPARASERIVRPLAANARKPDIRVIAATNVDPMEACGKASCARTCTTAQRFAVHCLLRDRVRPTCRARQEFVDEFAKE